MSGLALKEYCEAKLALQRLQQMLPKATLRRDNYFSHEASTTWLERWCWWRPIVQYCPWCWRPRFYGTGTDYSGRYAHLHRVGHCERTAPTPRFDVGKQQWQHARPEHYYCTVPEFYSR